MRLDYHREAFVIAGEMKNQQVVYYTYDQGCFTWTRCVFDANLYNSSEEVSTFMRNIVADKNSYPLLKRIWVEKLAPFKADGELQITL